VMRSFASIYLEIPYFDANHRYALLASLHAISCEFQGDNYLVTFSKRLTFVQAHKNRALVEGMRIQNEYKITVVAIGSLGDSNHSNAGTLKPGL
jgi:hypothetical protein